MGYRILIVDDSPVLRIMLQEMLEAMGHEIVGEAEDGATAVALYREKKPDLVTLDVSLPDMNGIEVLQNIRRVDSAAKVLMVTGNDQKAIETKALALKALGVLRKPFDEGDLRKMLEKCASHIKR
ncbi:MAG: response regulator [Elusimicrobiota bacterium]